MASEPVAVLASIPAGPGLAAALAGLDVTAVSGFEAVLVLRAQSRQVNHERGLLARSVVEVLRRRDAEHGIGEGWQSGDLVGSAEVRAALVLTRPAAKDHPHPNPTHHHDPRQTPTTTSHPSKDRAALCGRGTRRGGCRGG